MDWKKIEAESSELPSKLKERRRVPPAEQQCRSRPRAADMKADLGKHDIKASAIDPAVPSALVKFVQRLGANDADVNERMLFHGTSFETAQSSAPSRLPRVTSDSVPGHHRVLSRPTASARGGFRELR